MREQCDHVWDRKDEMPDVLVCMKCGYRRCAKHEMAVEECNVCGMQSRELVAQMECDRDDLLAFAYMIAANPPTCDRCDQFFFIPKALSQGVTCDCGCTTLVIAACELIARIEYGDHR